MAWTNVAPITLASTFNDWVSKTNVLISVANTLVNGNFYKENGNFQVNSGAVTILTSSGTTLTNGFNFLNYGTVTTAGLVVLGGGPSASFTDSTVLVSVANTIQTRNLITTQNASFGNITVTGSQIIQGGSLYSANLIALRNGVSGTDYGTLVIQQGTSGNVGLRYNPTNTAWELTTTATVGPPTSATNYHTIVTTTTPGTISTIGLVVTGGGPSASFTDSTVLVSVANTIQTRNLITTQNASFGNIAVTGNATFGNIAVAGTQVISANLLALRDGASGTDYGTLVIQQGTSGNVGLRYNPTNTTWELTTTSTVGPPTSATNYQTIVTTTTPGYINQPVLKSAREYLSSPGTVGSSATVDLSTANFFKYTLTNSTPCTFTFSNPPTSNVFSFNMIIVQGSGGGSSVSFAGGTIKWAGGLIPPATTTASAIDIWTFVTYDGGSSYIGSLSVKNAHS